MTDFDALWNFSDPVATETAFRALLPEAEAVGGAYHLELLTQVARTLGLQRKFDEAHAILDLVEPQLTASTDRVFVRYALERGRTFNSSGNKEQARGLFLDAWERAKIAGEDNLAVDAAHMLAIVESGAESLRWNEIAMAHAEASNDPKARRWLGSLYNNTGWTYHELQRFDDALICFEKALALRVEQGNAENIRIAQWSVARCYRSLGRLDEALEVQDRLRTELETAGASDGYVFEEIAECLLALGRADEAPVFFARAYAELSKDSYLVANEAARLQRLHDLGRVS